MSSKSDSASCSSPSPAKKMNPSPSSSTPKKQKITIEDFSSPSPAKKMNPSPSSSTPKKQKITIEDFSKQLEMFHEDHDTKIKAILYSVMVGEADGAKDDLNKIRRTTAAFVGRSSFILKDLHKDANAVKQQLATQEKYNVHLHRENNDLRKEIQDLKKELHMKDLDSSMFDQGFDSEDGSGNDDDLDNPETNLKQNKGPQKPKKTVDDQKQQININDDVDCSTPV